MLRREIHSEQRTQNPYLLLWEDPSAHTVFLKSLFYMESTNVMFARSSLSACICIFHIEMMNTRVIYVVHATLLSKRLNCLLDCLFIHYILHDHESQGSLTRNHNLSPIESAASLFFQNL